MQPLGARTMVQRAIDPAAWLLASRWLLVALAVAIPISTALTNVCFALMFACWLASADFADKVRRIRANPAAAASVVCFVLVGAACLYSAAAPQAAVTHWVGYRKWLLIPIGVTLAWERSWQQRVLAAFVASAAAVLVVSFAIAATRVPFLGQAALTRRASFESQGIYGVVADNPTVQSLVFLAAALICVHVVAAGWRDAARRRRHLGLIALSAAFILNVLYLSGGRTGFVLCLAMLPVLAWQVLPRRTALLAAGVLACAVPLVWLSSPHLRIRTAAVMQDVQRYQSTGHADLANSVGLRLTFYRNGLHLLRARPWFGYGTGGIEPAYAALLAGQPGAGDVVTANLHNEYLNMAVQFGLVGLAAFLGWLASQWLAARRVAPPWRPVAQLLIVAFAIGSLANSHFTSSHEGHLYCLLMGVLLARAETQRTADEGGAA